MGAIVADANLLFGALALQLDFITRDQLIVGIQSWVHAKQTALGEHLVNARYLSVEHCRVLEALVVAHVGRHEDDARKSLAVVSSAQLLKRQLAHIEDPDLQHSLQSLPPNNVGDANATLSLPTPSAQVTRFIPLRHHARGGLGEVWIARDVELGREVALKEIQLDKDGPESRARFIREAEITGSLEHPGIVPVYGLGAYPDGRPYYAMRFIRGESLDDAIKAFHREHSGTGFQPSSDSKEAAGKMPAPPFSWLSASTNETSKNLRLRHLLQRFIDVCQAIHYAHNRGILHRDLKPGNVMLGRYGETLVVDWGLAKALAEKPEIDVSQSMAIEPPLTPVSSNDGLDATRLGSALGTPAYMSPEQAEGRIDLLSPASDVFCLGATLYHLVTGKPPYAGNGVHEVQQSARTVSFARPRQVKSEVPKPLEAICLKAMAKSADRRYATAQDLARDVERFLADEPVAAAPDGLVERSRRIARRYQVQILAAAMAALTVSAISLAAVFIVNRALQEVVIISKEIDVLQQRLALATSVDERAALQQQVDQSLDDIEDLATSPWANTPNLIGD